MRAVQNPRQQLPPSIAHLLSPWKSNFARMHATGFTDKDHGVAGIRLSLRSPADLLREAMELLSLAVLVDGNVVRDLVQLGWIKLQGATAKKKPTESEVTALFGSSRVREIAFSTGHDGLDVREFQEALVTVLPISTATPLARDDCPYETVRETLVSMIMDRGLDQRLTQPVAITCHVRSLPAASTAQRRVLDERFFYRCLGLAAPLYLLDFFSHLTRLATHLREYRQRPVPPTNGATTLRGFHVDHMALALGTCFSITSEIVQATQRLMDADDCGRVVCTKLMLDPRLIACGPEELLTFTRTMSRGSSGLVVKTGFSPRRIDHRMKAIDAGGEDRTELMGSLIRAIAACEKLTSVDMGGLLYLVVQPHNRQCLWRTLIEELLDATHVSSPPIGELMFKANAVVTDADIQCIAQFRGDGTTRLLRTVYGFHVALTDTSETNLLALLTLATGVSALSLQSVGTAQITRILDAYPNMRSVHLRYSAIDSMAVFTGLACLQLLELEMPTIRDRTSIATFLQALAEPATTLQTFVLAQRSYDLYALDTAAATALQHAMEKNRTLHTIIVPLRRDVPLEVKEALLSHNGDVITTATSTTPQYAAMQTAFLSVIYAQTQGTALRELDAVLTRQIFACAAPFVERRVLLNAIGVQNPDFIQ